MALKPIAKVTRPNNIVERYVNDPLGRLKETTQTDADGQNQLLMNRYDYDPQGNVVKEFKCDLLDRRHESINYGYDSHVNRMSYKNMTNPFLLCYNHSMGVNGNE
jgi:hypothetical protein